MPNQSAILLYIIIIIIYLFICYTHCSFYAHFVYVKYLIICLLYQFRRVSEDAAKTGLSLIVDGTVRYLVMSKKFSTEINGVSVCAIAIA